MNWPIDKPQSSMRDSLNLSFQAATETVRTRRNSLKAEETVQMTLTKSEEDALKSKIGSITSNISATQTTISNTKADIARLKSAIQESNASYESQVNALKEELKELMRDRDSSFADPQLFVRKDWIKSDLSTQKKEHNAAIETLQKSINSACLKSFAEATRLHALKADLTETRGLLLDFYYKTLKQGTVCFKHGIRWVVEAIWTINEPVSISTFPTFLDKQSVQHLLDQAEREVELMGFRTRFRQIQGIVHQHQEGKPAARLNNVTLYTDLQTIERRVEYGSEESSGSLL
jgi:hypothetical protein